MNHKAESAGTERQDSQKLLLTATEAAEALSICPRSLWTRTNTGEIPHVRIGRSVRYSVADLERWIAAHRKGGVA